MAKAKRTHRRALRKTKDAELPIAVRRGPKPKKTKIVGEWLDEVVLFQKTFSPYFDHLTDDLDTAGFEMSWLHTRVLGNPIDTVRRTKAKAELAKIRAALILMGRHHMGYWQKLNWKIFEAKKRGDDLAEDLDKIFGFLLLLDEMNGDGRLEKVIKKFSDDASNAIDAVPDHKNIHWKALHAVEGLRILWWRNMGKVAPSRALNPASSFASYLRDGFWFLGVKANPEAAFKRWAAAYPKSDS